MQKQNNPAPDSWVDPILVLEWSHVKTKKLQRPRGVIPGFTVFTLFIFFCGGFLFYIKDKLCYCFLWRCFFYITYKLPGTFLCICSQFSLYLSSFVAVFFLYIKDKFVLLFFVAVFLFYITYKLPGTFLCIRWQFFYSIYLLLCWFSWCTSKTNLCCCFLVAMFFVTSRTNFQAHSCAFAHSFHFIYLLYTSNTNSC